jgi:hypothetical protein
MKKEERSMKCTAMATGPRALRARKWARTVMGVCLTLFATSPRAEAHNKKVHQDMTDLGFQIMRLAGVNPRLFPAPAGVSPAEWEAFRIDVVEATKKLGHLDPDFKPAGSDRCLVEVDGVSQTRAPGWSDWRRVQDAEPLRSTFGTGGPHDGCGLQAGYTPGGIYNVNQGSGNEYTGLALGVLAAGVDDEFDDSHLWFRPANAGVLGAGTVIEAADDALDLGLAVVLLPFVCLWSWLGGGGNCISQALDMADAANPIDTLAGAIPGIGDLSGDDWVGLWHHINLTPGRSHDYDDVQGLLLDEAGWLGAPDAVEVALTAAFDLSGLSLDYGDSQGPKNYQVTGAGDFHPDTRVRSRSQWQFHTLPHTPMEPLDNLAFFGWRLFRLDTSHPGRALGWPLHALGDAVSPMHTIGSPGWGHRPFEDSVETIWREIRFNPLYPTPAHLAEQHAQARRIFAEAFRWRRFVLDWRRRHGGGAPPDVPVRDLVTALARETHDYSNQKMVSDVWPYNPVASAVYIVDEPAAALFYDRSDAAALVRPLIENGVAAKIALLTSAAEVF